jgi:hypothetical protein
VLKTVVKTVASVKTTVFLTGENTNLIPALFPVCLQTARPNEVYQTSAK